MEVHCTHFVDSGLLLTDRHFVYASGPPRIQYAIDNIVSASKLFFIRYIGSCFELLFFIFDFLLVNTYYCKHQKPPQILNLAN